ncbi:MAG: HAMP domain-containing histidine kinase, partial [Lachnospiraceae bacterium]|nr:HAMP domain-containing histidine kinase [Lachnospiraceae bacterium]
MSEQIDYVNGLVGDLLERSRMEMKAKELNREPVNLGELNDMVLGKLSALTADREVTVNKPDDTESLTVQADLGMMRTVLMNLITNAIRYGEKKIVIDISKKRDAVRYQITNDGTPIPADQLDLIWD